MSSKQRGLSMDDEVTVDLPLAQTSKGVLLFVDLHCVTTRSLSNVISLLFQINYRLAECLIMIV